MDYLNSFFVSSNYEEEKKHCALLFMQLHLETDYNNAAFLLHPM